MNNTRILSLDILRGVAIFLVLFRHLPVLPDIPELQGFVRDTLLFLRRGGWVGVDLFFVLSGFLVSGLIFKEYQKSQSFRPFHFLIRRGFKIYPALYFCAAVLYVWIYVRNGGHVLDWRQIVGELFFLQNYLGNFVQVTWSLAIEEHFYVSLAVLLYALSRKGGANPFTAIPAIFGVLAIGVLLLRIFTYEPGYYLYLLMSTHLRADALFYGVFLSYLYHFHTERLQQMYSRWRIPLLALVPLLLAYTFTHELEDNAFICTVGFSLHSIAFSILLLAAVLDLNAAALPRPLAVPLRAMGFVGVYSYSIYLWHETIYKVLWSKTLVYTVAEAAGPVAAFYLSLLVLLLCAIGGGVLAAFLIEVPFLKLRERWFPMFGKPAQPVAPQESAAK